MKVRASVEVDKLIEAAKDNRHVVVRDPRLWPWCSAMAY